MIKINNDLEKNKAIIEKYQAKEIKAKNTFHKLQEKAKTFDIEIDPERAKAQTLLNEKYEELKWRKDVLEKDIIAVRRQRRLMQKEYNAKTEKI